MSRQRVTVCLTVDISEVAIPTVVPSHKMDKMDKFLAGNMWQEVQCHNVNTAQPPFFFFFLYMYVYYKLQYRYRPTVSLTLCVATMRAT